MDAIVGQRIREYRIARGLNQTRLANMAGVSFQQLQKYENGENRVSASRLYFIARALDVPIDELMGELPRKPVGKRKVPSSGGIPWTRETLQMFKYALKVPASSRRALLDMALRVSG